MRGRFKPRAGGRTPSLRDAEQRRPGGSPHAPDPGLRTPRAQPGAELLVTPHTTLLPWSLAHGSALCTPGRERRAAPVHTPSAGGRGEQCGPVRARGQTCQPRSQLPERFVSHAAPAETPTSRAIHLPPWKHEPQGPAAPSRVANVPTVIAETPSPGTTDTWPSGLASRPGTMFSPSPTRRPVSHLHSGVQPNRVHPACFHRSNCDSQPQGTRRAE